MTWICDICRARIADSVQDHKDHHAACGDTIKAKGADMRRRHMELPVYDALKKHNALDNELCRSVADAVWQHMQKDFDGLYKLWEGMIKSEEELLIERNRLRNSLMRVKEELGTVRETVGAALEGRL